jgi:hypothetical protein
MNVLVPLAVFGNLSGGDGQFVGGFLASVITAAIWTAYLSRSKRVRVTFAHCVPDHSQQSDERRELLEVAPDTPPQRSSPEKNPSESQKPSSTATNLQEEFWAEALREYESTARRPGLYARFFSEAQGNEAVAKANYLRFRLEELSAEYQRHINAKEEAEREAREQAKLSKQTEEQRAYEMLPKGRCPNCEAVIPLSTTECPKCRAVFGADSAWKILPIKTA